MRDAQSVVSENMNKWKESAKELKILHNLVFCGLMAALGVVLSFVASIDVGPYLKIGFSSIPDRIIDCLFGPVTGAIFGGTLNIIKYFVKPSGDFNLLFTLNAMLADLIYGYFLYKKPVTIKNLLVSGFIVKLVVNVINNTALLALMYGNAISAILPVRAVKNLVMWPVDALVQFVIITAVLKAFRQLKGREGGF